MNRFTLGLIVGIAATYYLAPSKTVEKTIKDTKRSSEVQKDTNKKEVVKKVTKPDGTVVETRKTEVAQEVNRKSESKTHSEHERITERSSKVNLSLLGGLNLANGISGPIYGAHITKNVLGPFSLGAFVLTNKTFGVSLGIEL